jgi:hypothetical protein
MVYSRIFQKEFWSKQRTKQEMSLNGKHIVNVSVAVLVVVQVVVVCHAP